MAALALSADRYAEAKARDALAFEPLPQRPWLNIGSTGITVRVNYAEALSQLLRALPGARWDAATRSWRYPFSAADDIRKIVGRIDALAARANESADEETRRSKSRRLQAAAEIAAERQERARRRAAAIPMAFSREYLSPIAGAPRYALCLEAIGDNNRASGAPARNWVARLFGSDGRGGWARVFLPGMRDYASANSQGSRGIVVTYFLDQGPIYEISRPLSWRSTDRYFLRIVAGVPLRMSRAEVEAACLER